MLTKDSVTVSVDAVVYYRVSNATVSVANVENAHHSTRSGHHIMTLHDVFWRRGSVILAQLAPSNGNESSFKCISQDKF